MTTGLIRALREHIVHTAQAKGWDRLSNGALLKAAEDAAFDVLLTTDRRIRYQQNLSARRIALVVLTGSTKWSRVRQRTDEIAATVATAIPGSYTEVEIPFDSEPPAQDAQRVAQALVLLLVAWQRHDVRELFDQEANKVGSGEAKPPHVVVDLLVMLWCQGETHRRPPLPGKERLWAGTLAHSIRHLDLPRRKTRLAPRGDDQPQTQMPTTAPALIAPGLPEFTPAPRLTRERSED